MKANNSLRPDLDPRVVELIERDDMYAEYAQRLLKHITAVQQAGRKLGVHPDQLHCHDMSKWSFEEFYAYARKFCADDLVRLDPQTRIEFNAAFLHHVRHNPHHWQHWILPSERPGRPDRHGSRPSRPDTLVPMPAKYLLEMVADWMGASLVYSGTEDLIPWLNANWWIIRLHPDTRSQCRTVLWSMGYHLEVLSQARPPWEGEEWIEE